VNRTALTATLRKKWIKYCSENLNYRKNLRGLNGKNSAGNYAFRASWPINKVPDKRTFTICMLTVAERVNVGLKDNPLLILLIELKLSFLPKARVEWLTGLLLRVQVAATSHFGRESGFLVPRFFLLLSKVIPGRYKSGHYRFPLYPYIQCSIFWGTKSIIK